MTFIAETFYLVQKDVLAELRSRSALAGLALYLASSVTVCYLSLQAGSNQLPVPVWNALLWLIVLFTSLQAVAKSFSGDQSRRLYYYTLASAEAIICSKLIYNTLLIWLLTCPGYLLYALMIGNPVQTIWLFWLSLLLGGLGLSSVLTLVAALAARASQGNVLMAVLGFPVVLPVLLMTLKLSKTAIDGLDPSLAYDEITTLMALCAIATSVSVLLFPYLWRS